MKLCYDAEFRLHHSPFLSLSLYTVIIDHLYFLRNCSQISVIKISQCSFM